MVASVVTWPSVSAALPRQRMRSRAAARRIASFTRPLKPAGLTERQRRVAADRGIPWEARARLVHGAQGETSPTPRLRHVDDALERQIVGRLHEWRA